MLAHRLAAARGFPHADHLLAELTSTQFAELVALERVDPCGEWRDDWRVGQCAAILYNANRSPNSPPLDVREFMWHVESSEMDAEEQKRQMAGITTPVNK